MASSIHSAEKRLYEKLGMENPNKPKVYTSTVKEGPTIHKVRVIAHDGSKKIPPPVSAKPIFYKASIQQQKVPEKAKPSSASVGAGNSQAKQGTKSMEDELADLTDLLVKNLDNTSDPDFYGKTLNNKHLNSIKPFNGLGSVSASERHGSILAVQQCKFVSVSRSLKLFICFQLIVPGSFLMFWKSKKLLKKYKFYKGSISCLFS